jgi:Asp-tRNA(Asn)/Glu-tRNA(Gln) amidotransferase A subunit family amidase
MESLPQAANRSAAADDLLTLSACDLAAMIRSRVLSPVELISRTLNRIGEVRQAFNPFTIVLEEEAMASARSAETALMQGAAIGPLHGLPVAIKDFTPSKGHRTTLGSAIFRDWVPTENPVIVKRLLAAGAIIVAKTTTPEFAYSSFTQSPLWGVTTNPWNMHHTPGGSSGGSAVAVVTGATALAEGTDMGGSVRIPAALSGCVGLKPSLGRIPMDILPTVFDNISHFGPLSRSVYDAAMFLRAVEGPDDSDIQSQIAPTAMPINLDGNVTGLRIAASPDLGIFAVDGEILASLDESVAALRQGGATVDWVELNWPLQYARYWYEYWGVVLAATHGKYLDTHREMMDPQLVATIESGMEVSAVAMERTSHLRTAQWRDMARLFGKYDALVCPTTAKPAPAANCSDSDFEAVDNNGRLHGLDMTAIFNNVSVCPALAVPNGTTKSGLPTSLQIVGRRFDDPTVLRIGAYLETVRPWPVWDTSFLPASGVIS